MCHDMAPVAYAIANAQEDGLSSFLLFVGPPLPRIPVNRIVSMLEQIRLVSPESLLGF